MLVKEIMTTEIVTVEPDTLVVDAAKKMVEAKTKFLIVTKDEKLVGIVTDWDFLSKLIAVGKDASKTKIEEIMTSKVMVVTPDTDIEEAAKVMSEYNIKKLPVVGNGVLLGVVTAMDIVAAEPKIIDQISELVLTTKKDKFVAG